MSNSSIWPIERTLSSATTQSQSGPGSDGNEGLFHIPKSSSITGASPSDCLVSYPGQSLVRPYLSAEMQLYSTAPANWASERDESICSLFSCREIAQTGFFSLDWTSILRERKLWIQTSFTLLKNQPWWTVWANTPHPDFPFTTSDFS